MFCFWRKEKCTKGKDVAKFLAGAATVEIINHIYLAFSNILPMYFFGFMISKTTNIVILIAWIIVLKISIYKAWFKKD